MPAAVIKSFAKKTGKSESELEALWDRAMEEAKKQGHDGEYDYVMGIFKNMCGIKESIIVELNGKLLLY